MSSNQPENLNEGNLGDGEHPRNAADLQIANNPAPERGAVSLSTSNASSLQQAAPAGAAAGSPEAAAAQLEAEQAGRGIPRARSSSSSIKRVIKQRRLQRESDILNCLPDPVSFIIRFCASCYMFKRTHDDFYIYILNT